MFLVKLYIGVGRYRSGERVAANAHVRTYAATSLAWTLRLRLGATPSSNPYDPLRRLEVSLPGVGNRLADLLDADLEACARGMLGLTRTALEPDWPDFPTDAANLLETRLGWSRCKDRTAFMPRSASS